MLNITKKEIGISIGQKLVRINRRVSDSTELLYLEFIQKESIKIYIYKKKMKTLSNTQNE